MSVCSEVLHNDCKTHPFTEVEFCARILQNSVIDTYSYKNILHGRYLYTVDNYPLNKISQDMLQIADVGYNYKQMRNFNRCE